MSDSNKIVYIVKAKRQEAPQVVTLELTTETGLIPTFTPGQYITVYFPETGTPEGKSYSISSAPHEQKLSITVKAIGEFSNRLFNLDVGSTLLASLPYGFFYSEETNTPLVMIAGGIGVTPFRSIISQTLVNQPNRSLTLYYSNQSVPNIVFRSDFSSFIDQNKSLSVNHYITRQKVESPYRSGRFVPKDTMPKSTDNSEFMICGSISFVRDMWHNLKDIGVPEESIYTESFF